jgi:glycosyltransferase involved in cell wall biosynthesis
MAGHVSDRIRLLIDGTVLGYAGDAGHGRAGTFRMAQAFVAEALTRPELEISLAGLDSYFADIQLERHTRHAGPALESRRIAAWRHPSIDRDASVALVDRAALSGEGSEEARRLLAAMALTNRMARAAGPLGPYDIYHSPRHGLAPASHVATRARVLFIHDLFPVHYPEWFPDGAAAAFAGVLASVDPDRDWLLCNSEYTRQDLCAHTGIDPARTFVTPLAADPVLFHPVTDAALIARTRRRYGLADRPYLLSLSTIEPRKNLPHLIRAFARLLDDSTHSDLTLVLSGATGWKTEPVFDALRHHPGLESRVSLTGWVPDADLAPLSAGADVFVYPSRDEGFGLPVLEAMRCGVPVVTTTGGALPEVVGAAGCLVAPDDEDALVHAIGAARGRRDLPAAGLSRAAAFTWARTVDLTIAAYRVMLSRAS